MQPMKTLEETVELMLSDKREDRIKAEYFQLENRFIHLTEMLMEWDVGRLDPVPAGNRYLYGECLGHMRNYLQSLQNIAKAESIDLNGNGTDVENSDDDTAGTE